MFISKLSLVLCMLLLASLCVFGATIQGTIYDAELSIAKQAIVSISSEPEQLMVASSGVYKFVVIPGSYVVSANNSLGAANFSIIITSDGEYIHDLILFPRFPVSELENQTTLELNNVEQGFQPSFSWLVILLLVLVSLFSVWFMKRKYHKSTSQSVKSESEQLTKQAIKSSLDEQEQVLAVLRKEGGRATQKDVRRFVPFSEAKVSLIISQLEHAGKIEKIKKGRGNILVLK